LPTTPRSPRSPRRSTEPSHAQIDQEYDEGRTSHSRLEELGYSSPLRNRDQDEEEPQEQQQPQEVAGEAAREDDDEDDDREQGQHREKRRRQNETEEINNDIHHSESSDRSYDTNSEDDEDPRPAKKRKLPTISTDMALTPPREHSLKPRLTPPHSLTPPSATQLKMDNAQSQADHRHPPTPIYDEHHHTPGTSQSPSATIESVPIAEYQEWPFQGFLKRTTIGNETTYNLEFKLPRILERLNLPISPEALGIGSSTKTLAEAANSHVTHSKIHSTLLRPQIKRPRWTPEEDATVLKMRGDGCSWEEIHAALYHRSKEMIQVRYSTKLEK
jgi:hypothetical protein